MLYEALTQGTATFKVQEDGTETVEHRPPTTLHLQAARHIKQLTDQLNQLSVAHTQLQQHYQQLLEHTQQLDWQVNNLKNQLNEKNEPTIQPDV